MHCAFASAIRMPVPFKAANLPGGVNYAWSPNIGRPDDVSSGLGFSRIDWPTAGKIFSARIGFSAVPGQHAAP